MSRVVGIVCCAKTIGEFHTLNHAVSDTYVRATASAVGAVPILIPADAAAADVATVLSLVDGLMLTGSRSNVQPSRYGGPAHPEGVPEDLARDSVAFALLGAAIERRMPVLAICRGLQELNVARGGTLHQRLQDLDGRLDHSTRRHPDLAVRVGKAHPVSTVPGGTLRALGAGETIMVNSLHNQGIDRLGDGLQVEATALDGTIEAVRLLEGFVLGVQWHPEYDFDTDPVSRGIFTAFADAIGRSDRTA